MKRSKRWVGMMFGAAWVCVASSACFWEGGNTGIDDDDLLLLGTIVAGTSTRGPSSDPDGYLVSLDESRIQPIDINGGVTFMDLKVGGWDVTLEGVASNCVIAGANPVPVMLFADSIVQTQFDVTCS